VLKGRIEAILFLTGKALTIAEIAEKLAEPVEEVEEALLELMHDYSFREESALEIDDADGYILQVKDQYSSVVNQMIPVELSIAALRTLSAIAIHGPILQSGLIEIRGSAAYDHIKELLKYQLISKRRKERSYMLNVTPKFHEYFKLTGDKNELKQLALQLAESEKDEEADMGDVEGPEALEHDAVLLDASLSSTTDLR
jgi:segregation and condensation protein B